MSNINFDKFKLIIQKSKLNKEEQHELLPLFLQASNHDIKEINDLFESNPETIELVYNNYKAKQKAFIENDVEAMKKILVDEEKELENIDK